MYTHIYRCTYICIHTHTHTSIHMHVLIPVCWPCFSAQDRKMLSSIVALQPCADRSRTGEGSQYTSHVTCTHMKRTNIQVIFQPNFTLCAFLGRPSEFGSSEPERPTEMTEAFWRIIKLNIKQNTRKCVQRCDNGACIMHTCREIHVV